MRVSVRPTVSQEASRGNWRVVRLLLWFVTVSLIMQALIGDGGLTARLRVINARRTLADSIAALKSENRRLSEAARRLQNDPRALKAVAREKLGLIAPGEVLFIVTERRESAHDLE